MSDVTIDFNAASPQPEPIPIETKLSWMEIFGGVLVEPQQTMRRLVACSDAHSGGGAAGIGGAALAVIIPFALDGLRVTPPLKLWLAWFNVPLSVMLGLMLWLTLSGVLALLASIFGVSASCNRRAFILLGWSFVPWILMSPLYCFREILGPSYVLVAALPMLWSFILQMLAVKESFQLKAVQILALFFIVPVLYKTQMLTQVVQGIYVVFNSLI